MGMRKRYWILICLVLTAIFCSVVFGQLAEENTGLLTTNSPFMEQLRLKLLLGGDIYSSTSKSVPSEIGGPISMMNKGGAGWIVGCAKGSCTDYQFLIKIAVIILLSLLFHYIMKEIFGAKGWGKATVLPVFLAWLSLFFLPKEWFNLDTVFMDIFYLVLALAFSYLALKFRVDLSKRKASIAILFFVDIIILYLTWNVLQNQKMDFLTKSEMFGWFFETAWWAYFIVAIVKWVYVMSNVFKSAESFGEGSLRTLGDTRTGQAVRSFGSWLGGKMGEGFDALGNKIGNFRSIGNANAELKRLGFSTAPIKMLTVKTLENEKVVVVCLRRVKEVIGKLCLADKTSPTGNEKFNKDIHDSLEQVKRARGYVLENKGEHDKYDSYCKTIERSIAGINVENYVQMMIDQIIDSIMRASKHNSITTLFVKSKEFGKIRIELEKENQRMIDIKKFVVDLDAFVKFEDKSNQTKKIFDQKISELQEKLENAHPENFTAESIKYYDGIIEEIIEIIRQGYAPTREQQAKIDKISTDYGNFVVLDKSISSLPKRVLLLFAEFEKRFMTALSNRDINVWYTFLTQDAGISETELVARYQRIHQLFHRLKSSGEKKAVETAILKNGEEIPAVAVATDTAISNTLKNSLDALYAAIDNFENNKSQETSKAVIEILRKLPDSQGIDDGIRSVINALAQRYGTSGLVTLNNRLLQIPTANHQQIVAEVVNYASLIQSQGTSAVQNNTSTNNTLKNILNALYAAINDFENNKSEETSKAVIDIMQKLPNSQGIDNGIRKIIGALAQRYGTSGLVMLNNKLLQMPTANHQQIVAEVINYILMQEAQAKQHDFRLNFDSFKTSFHHLDANTDDKIQMLLLRALEAANEAEVKEIIEYLTSLKMALKSTIKTLPNKNLKNTKDAILKDFRSLEQDHTFDQELHQISDLIYANRKAIGRVLDYDDKRLFGKGKTWRNWLKKKIGEGKNSKSLKEMSDILNTKQREFIQIINEDNNILPEEKDSVKGFLGTLGAFCNNLLGLNPEKQNFHKIATELLNAKDEPKIVGDDITDKIDEIFKLKQQP